MSVPLVRQGYYPSEDDYYVILDVDFNASTETITAAYRNLARRFHPDKNNQDERSRKEAEVIFQKIKTAYDVLSDPHKRKIYDTLGPEGLKLDGWKLVPKQMTAREIREEYLRFQQQLLDNKQAIIAKPRAEFTVAVDASDIFSRSKIEEDFEEIDEDLVDTIYYSLPTIEISSLSASMAVENNIAINHSMTLSGNLMSKNGIGHGTVGTIYKYKFSPATIFNVAYQVGRGPVLTVSVNHEINEKTSINCRGTVLFDTTYIAPGAKITLTRQIRNYLIGKVSYKEGINPSVSTTLIYLNEKLMLELTTTYRLSKISQGILVNLGYRFNNKESKLSVSLGASSNEGVAVEYGCETRVFEINVIGAALSFNLEAGVTLKLRLNRANQEFSMPIYLSDEVYSGPLFYGTMVPLIAYYLMDRCYMRQYKKVH